MSGTHAPHLQRRNGIYHLRMRIPGRLRHRVERMEVNRSLKTYSSVIARNLAAKVSAQVQETFIVIEKNTQLTPADARNLLQHCVQGFIDEVDQNQPLVPLTDYPELEISEQHVMAQGRINTLVEQCEKWNFKPDIPKAAAGFLRRKNIDFEGLDQKIQLKIQYGLVKPKLLKSMDSLLWEHVLTGFLSWNQPPHEAIVLSSSQKWLNISALQKAIRRGQVERAIQFAKQGCQLDADHVFRRLAVCALEDVGIGNFLAVASCLTVLGDKKQRREAGETELAAYLAKMLAESPKSRLACDLLSLVEYNPALKQLISEWAKASDHDLAQRVRDEALPIEKRMLATWLLAGTHRFQSGVLPKSNYRPRASLMKEMAKAKMPLILYYAADRGATRTSDALFCSYLQSWELIKDASDHRLMENVIPPSEMIGNFPAEAYDMHTREGRLAIRASETCVTKIVSESKREKEVIQNAIFAVEGGLLLQEVVSDQVIPIKGEAMRLELGSVSVLQLKQLLDRVGKSLPQLNSVRSNFAR